LFNETAENKLSEIAEQNKPAKYLQVFRAFNKGRAVPNLPNVLSMGIE